MYYIPRTKNPNIQMTSYIWTLIILNICVINTAYLVSFDNLCTSLRYSHVFLCQLDCLAL